ncbi:hypothetical protein [Paraburkholderia sediminicola]|uniref:hypothetical protein n=1 Tax=Paraburkholderia sediminicola TaxID=458836 RepID=UPI0038B78168
MKNTTLIEQFMRNSVPNAVMAHLHAIASPTIDSFRTAPFLRSAFGSADWSLVIGHYHIKLNWNVSLGEDRLTDKRHQQVLTIFKCWILSQSHPRVTGGRIHGSAYLYRRVTRVIAHIDYMLLNRELFGLEKYGLRAATENDFLEMLRAIESGVGFANATYEWPTRLAKWLDKLVERYRPALAKTLRENRFLREMHTLQIDWRLAKDKRTLIRWRVALWVGGYYRSIGNHDFVHTVDTELVSTILYEDTLRGVSSKPLFDELGLIPVERCLREKTPVPVRASGERPTKQDVGYQRSTLKTLAALQDVCDGVPAGPLLAALGAGPIDVESLRDTRGFAIAPFPVVMRNIKYGTEFCLRHGEHIVKSFAALVAAAKSEELTLFQLVERHGLEGFLNAKTLALGVRRLSVGLQARADSRRRIPQEELVKRYFASLRNNEGLVELGRVFIGSVIQCIGPVTARRRSELVRLPVSRVLDESRENIIFGNAKTGLDDKKQEEVRPVPKLVSHVVQICEELHASLGSFDTGMLLDMPGVCGMRRASKTTFDICLDAFADYFEVACDSQGRRWYVRQHQNRKFLVLAFYYGIAEGNVHAIRWMLGHGDVEHLWHYLMTSIPGEMLKEVQAYFMLDALRNHPFEPQQIEMHEDVVAALEDGMERRFGTRRFDVVDTELLQSFLDMAVKKGLSALPHFFEVGGHKIARIAVTLSRSANI